MSNENRSVAVTTVIKHAEGNNNQDLAWKFCVLQQNVQCWKKNKMDY
jgi:hypothetical protein